MLWKITNLLSFFQSVTTLNFSFIIMRAQNSIGWYPITKLWTDTNKYMAGKQTCI